MERRRDPVFPGLAGPDLRRRQVPMLTVPPQTGSLRLPRNPSNAVKPRPAQDADPARVLSAVVAVL
ncbi:MAG: hypothetical protein CMJ59_15590 [Planctomycetaceae bacterium]|nr:hypothetical protein [Planctomycetaceae bacterium]